MGRKTPARSMLKLGALLFFLIAQLVLANATEEQKLDSVDQSKHRELELSSNEETGADSNTQLNADNPDVARSAVEDHASDENQIPDGPDSQPALDPDQRQTAEEVSSNADIPDTSAAMEFDTFAFHEQAIVFHEQALAKLRKERALAVSAAADSDVESNSVAIPGTSSATSNARGLGIACQSIFARTCEPCTKKMSKSVTNSLKWFSHFEHELKFEIKNTAGISKAWPITKHVLVSISKFIVVTGLTTLYTVGLALIACAVAIVGTNVSGKWLVVCAIGAGGTGVFITFVGLHSIWNSVSDEGGYESFGATAHLGEDGKPVNAIILEDKERQLGSSGGCPTDTGNVDKYSKEYAEGFEQHVDKSGDEPDKFSCFHTLFDKSQARGKSSDCAVVITENNAKADQTGKGAFIQIFENYKDEDNKEGKGKAELSVILDGCKWTSEDSMTLPESVKVNFSHMNCKEDEPVTTLKDCKVVLSKFAETPNHLEINPETATTDLSFCGEFHPSVPKTKYDVEVAELKTEEARQKYYEDNKADIDAWAEHVRVSWPKQLRSMFNGKRLQSEPIKLHD